MSTFEPCNFFYSDLVNASRPAEVLTRKRELKLLINRIAIKMNYHFPFTALFLASIPYLFPPVRFSFVKKRNTPSKQSAETNNENTLKTGDWVQVRPIEEIFSTLDNNRKYRGLYFMPEMEKYCGGKYRVYKNVRKIMLESTVEIRELISPTVFLEGVMCSGEAHGGCDRSCFLYWREIWLNKLPDEEVDH